MLVHFSIDLVKLNKVLTWDKPRPSNNLEQGEELAMSFCRSLATGEIFQSVMTNKMYEALCH